MDKYYFKVENGICVEMCYNVEHIPQGTPIGAWFCHACGFMGKEVKIKMEVI